MAKIIVFTDLHITVDDMIIGLDPHARFEQGFLHALDRHPDADRIVCTGDLTNRGDVGSYERLRDLIDQAPMPVDLLVGNHDERVAFKSVFPNQPVDENGFLQSTVDIDGWRLIYLDTLNAPPYVYPEAYCGMLCDQRMAWLSARLEEAATVPTIVFLHHPPNDVGFPGMDAIKLKNGAAFYDLITAVGNTRQVIAGHVHRTISGAHRGIPYAIFKSPCHQQPMQLGCHDISASVDEPGAYGILVTTPDGVIVHTEDFALSTGEAHSEKAALGAGG